jgi:predicted GIY-YIG superfamily endonuclease
LKSDSGEYKIGVSKHPEKRLKQHQTGNPENISLICKFQTEIPYKVETAVKNFLVTYRKNREWFEFPLEVEYGFYELCKRSESNLLLLQEKKYDDCL